MKRALWGCLLPGAVVLLALGASSLLFVGGQQEVRRVEAPETRASVRVVGVERGAVELSLTRVGEVAAAQDVEITSEVSGTLRWVLPELHAGMRVEAGTVVARLDSTAFDAQVASARATVADAEQTLALELGQGNVAALEAELVGPIQGSNPALVRREPQRAAAEAAVASAKASLKDAERNQRLTSIRAPFDAVLAEETLDVGRMVASSTTLGRWVGTERAEIPISVPLDAVGFFDRADLEITVRPQGSQTVREGRSAGLTGVVDPTTRTARLLVLVDEPYVGAPLLPGSFAEVTVRGGPAEDASRLPATALVDGAFVWSVTPENLLEKVPVQVLWRSGDEVVVAGVDGLLTVVERPAGTLLAGQQVRVRGQEEG